MMRTYKFGAVAALFFAGFAAAGAASDTGVAIDDSVITAKVKTALVADHSTKAHEISVKTVHGVVQLTGLVDSSEQKIEAARVAATVAGVKDVENDLEVKSL